MYPNTFIKPSLLTSLKSIGWSSILDGTQKTLGVINQAIPVFYQIKPVVSNMKSVFKIANIINEPIEKEEVKQVPTTNNTNPVFYI